MSDLDAGRISELLAKYDRPGPRYTSYPTAVEFTEDVGASMLGVDWRLDLADVRAALPTKPLQGNLDPGVVLGSPAAIEDGVRRVLRAAGTNAGHVFNLGHGFLPETPVENAEHLVKTVHAVSREMRA